MRGRRSRAAIKAGATLLLAAAVLAPAPAVATDSDLKHSYAFKLDASHGYSILAFAASQRADGRGEVVLIVSRGTASALYAAPATVTATRIDADLGQLGQVALEVTPSGRTRDLNTACAEEKPRTVSIEPPSFRGRFEFQGEEGFADASSTAPREYTRFFVDFACPGVSQGEISGPTLPGAELKLHARRGSFRLSLQANKNRPGARTRFEVTTHEKRRGVAISRSRELWLESGAFRFDRSLRTATLAPAAPFSGRAEFHRRAAPANRWTGGLSVDLPGRSNLPLTGAGVGATLSRACWHEGGGTYRC